MDPIEAVLISKCAGLTFPLVCCQVAGQIAIGNRVHDEPCNVNLRPMLVTWPLPKAQAAINHVLVPPQHVQHLKRMFAAGGLSQNLSLALGHGVTADNDSAIDPCGDVLGLLAGQSRDEL